MSANGKIFAIFVMLSTSNFYDVYTGTIPQRGQTVESTAVIFRHRLDVDSSDPLLLFHSNHTFMLSTYDVAISARLIYLQKGGLYE